MALFTMGEGYHNYHHEFQHDYRNGVKPWQWDPTKWLIWSFSKIGLTSGLRRAQAELISSSEANVRKTETSKARKTPNERHPAHTAAQESSLTAR
jgi:stearoyl-CoA desaturase (delta-9 desaturase)